MAVPSIQGDSRTVEHLRQQACPLAHLLATIVMAAVLGRQVWQYAAGPAGDHDSVPYPDHLLTNTVYSKYAPLILR